MATTICSVCFGGGYLCGTCGGTGKVSGASATTSLFGDLGGLGGGLGNMLLLGSMMGDKKSKHAMRDIMDLQLDMSLRNMEYQMTMNMLNSQVNMFNNVANSILTPQTYVTTPVATTMVTTPATSVTITTMPRPTTTVTIVNREATDVESVAKGIYDWFYAHSPHKSGKKPIYGSYLEAAAELTKLLVADFELGMSESQIKEAQAKANMWDRNPEVYDAQIGPLVVNKKYTRTKEICDDWYNRFFG